MDPINIGGLPLHGLISTKHNLTSCRSNFISSLGIDLIPVSDQDRISPYDINTMSIR